MDSTSTPAAVVSATILSACTDSSGHRYPARKEVGTHGDLNAIIGEDKRGVCRGELNVGLRGSGKRVVSVRFLQECPALMPSRV